MTQLWNDGLWTCAECARGFGFFPACTQALSDGHSITILLDRGLREVVAVRDCNDENLAVLRVDSWTLAELARAVEFICAAVRLMPPNPMSIARLSVVEPPSVAGHDRPVLRGAGSA
jgi:hypothetical protein